MLLLSAMLWPVSAVPPGLPLPPWIEVTATIDATPEMRQPFTVHGQIRVLLGKLDGARYKWQLPAGVHVVSGEPEGILTMTAGTGRGLDLKLEVRTPTPDASVTLDLVAPYPKAALLQEIEKTHAGKPQEDVEALKRHLSLLEGDHTFSGFAPFSVTEFEGFGSQEDVGFSLYFRPPGHDDLQFALLAPRAEPPAGGFGATGRAAATRDLFARNPKLAELFRSAGRDPSVLEARGVADDYSAAIRDLSAGRTESAAKELERLAAQAKSPGDAGFAAANARAAALFAAGRVEQAQKLWSSLADSKTAGPLARYAHFNLGELRRAGGQQAEARFEYQKALRLKPAFTLARQRLEHF